MSVWYDWKDDGETLRYYAEAAKCTGELDPIFLCNGLTPGFAARGLVEPSTLGVAELPEHPFEVRLVFVSQSLRLM